jgi:hypothetical protein
VFGATEPSGIFSQRLDLANRVVFEDPEKLPLDEFDALQQALQVPAPALTSVTDGAIQVIDR